MAGEFAAGLEVPRCAPLFLALALVLRRHVSIRFRISSRRFSVSLLESTMRLLPSFDRHLKEAAIIGRILAGYGELELLLGQCAGSVIDDQDRALRAIFRIISESARLGVADAIARHGFVQAGLRNEYCDAYGAAKHCLLLRNQYAHCHWADHHSVEGLFFTKLDLAAKRETGFDFEWLHVDMQLLELQEAYCANARTALIYLQREYAIRTNQADMSSFPQPQRLTPPPLHNPPEAHPPPWRAATPADQ
jgi:hypothetical protein